MKLFLLSFALQIYTLDQIQVQVSILTPGSINAKFCRVNRIDDGCARRLKGELMTRSGACNSKLFVLFLQLQCQNMVPRLHLANFFVFLKFLSSYFRFKVSRISFAL